MFGYRDMYCVIRPTDITSTLHNNEIKHCEKLKIAVCLAMLNCSFSAKTFQTNQAETIFKCGRELDVDLMNQSSFRTLDGVVDLKALVKSLPSEKEVREEQDVRWEWEKLFAEVTGALKVNHQEAAILQKTSHERIV